MIFSVTVPIYILLLQVFFPCIIINNFRPTLHMFSGGYHVPLQSTLNYHLTQLHVFSTPSFNINHYIHPPNHTCALLQAPSQQLTSFR